MTDDCDFCQREAEKFCLVEETKHSYAKICKWPLHPSHTLVIPKRHVYELEELNPDEAADFLGLITKIAKRISKVYEQPPKLFQNYGEHRTQPHLHLHLVSCPDNLRKLIAGNEQRILQSNEKMTEFASLLKKEKK